MSHFILLNEIVDGERVGTHYDDLGATDLGEIDGLIFHGDRERSGVIKLYLVHFQDEVNTFEANHYRIEFGNIYGT